MAGIAIAQLPIHEDLHRRLHPLMTFFIAVFLVTLGIKMDLSNLPAILPYAIGLSLFVLLVKPIIVFSILSFMRYSEYTAFQAAVATAQVSEFTFILLAMGATKDLIDSNIEFGLEAFKNRGAVIKQVNLGEPFLFLRVQFDIGDGSVSLKSDSGNEL